MRETSSAPDLTACDREPIHIPGSIQPHGLLLVADAETGEITAAAGDIEGRLAQNWLGMPLSGLLGQDIPPEPPITSAGWRLGPVRGLAETFDALLHRSGDRLLVELEPAESSVPAAVDVLSVLEAGASSFERAINLPELCDFAAKAFRRLTGYDRVMVYQFLDDDAGVVVAEDRDSAVASFLNHHFPASDIPKQARALYVRNRVRVIPDISYAPAPVRPALATPLDMSDVGLRSVSPIHVQYLRNMGVAASASVSIVKDGLLWGLIACHNHTPRPISLTMRMACRALASGLARQIRATEEALTYRERLRLRSLEDTVLARLTGDLAADAFVAGIKDDLRQALKADGFAALVGTRLDTAGHCPSTAELRELAEWLRARPAPQPVATHALSGQYPAAQAYQDRASGLLAVTLPAEEPLLLMWFRAEQIEVVNWAGNPHKASDADPSAILNPRTSFEAWSETVRGESAPWSIAEVETASRLAQAMSEARQNRRIRELNRELTATNAENERLLLQKDYLMREVNHRVQNSLQLVTSFLRLQARGAGDPTVVANLDEAQRRVAAVALVHRQLYGGDQLEIVDLSRYLDDLCSEMASSMGSEWKEKISLDLAPVLISADRAVKVGLILTELVINAAKYAYDGATGPLAIALEQHRNRLRLIVADRGSGKAGARPGFGTWMLNAMVQALSGEIEESSNEPGLRTIVTAPIAPAA